MTKYAMTPQGQYHGPLPVRNFFPMPNAIFDLGLTAEEIAVYAFLMSCEDRRTYTCYPSYKIIGKAIGKSKNTVIKYVSMLRGLYFEVFFMVENKKKYAYWMYPSMVKEIEKSLDMANATSKSDFVCQAVNFYIRYLHLGKSMNLLAPVLENTVHNEVESAERNLSEMMFKIAVELGMISNQLCNVYQFDRNAFKKLRENVAEEIASTNGIFTFDEAYLWQDN